MVAAVRQGKSLRDVAQMFQVSASTVKLWVDKAQGKRLDRADFSDSSSAPHRIANRTNKDMENLILDIRHKLRHQSDLGEFGAVAIRRELLCRGKKNLPALRTIGYILQRSGVLDSRQRVRRKPPAKGWYLPDVAATRAELDEFDFVEGLFIRKLTEVEVFNTVSLHGCLVGSFVRQRFSAKTALEASLKHWREWGLPDYAQFDNDNRFTGPRQHKDAIGRIIRLCLSLEVVPVFAPPSEHGFQNGIESYNGLWQAKVWARFEYKAMAEVQKQNSKYVKAHRERTRARREAAPERRRFPTNWSWDEKAKHTSGRIIFIRRTNDNGEAEVLGRKYKVSKHWTNRLLRCEVDIGRKEIRFYGLRRVEPENQPLLHKEAYELPLRYIN
jgi:hypothetical protein